MGWGQPKAARGNPQTTHRLRIDILEIVFFAQIGQRRQGTSFLMVVLPEDFTDMKIIAKDLLSMLLKPKRDPNTMKMISQKLKVFRIESPEIASVNTLPKIFPVIMHLDIAVRVK